MNISIFCSEELGSCYPRTEYQGKLGYDFELQFIPNENTNVKNPETIFVAVSRLDRSQSRASCIEFKAMERSLEDEKSNLYRTKVKILEAADDILIMAACDDEAPILTDAKLYSTADSTSESYRELTDKDFSEWSDEANASYTFGDFSLNHISNSLYYNLSGSDERSGLQGVRITETSEGGSRLSNDYAAFSGTYTLKTINDGKIKIDFQLVDNAGNPSAAKTYYVIKDTSIDENVIKFNQTKLSNFDYPPEEKEYPNHFYFSGMSVYNSVRKRNGNEDTVTLTFSSMPKDKFYSTYQTDYNISIKWGYSKDDISNAVTETSSSDGVNFTFTHNTKKDTFVKITVSDAVGNTKEIVRALPSQAVISSVTKITDTYDPDWSRINLTYANQALYESLCSYYGASRFLRWTIIKNTTEGDASWYQADDTPVLRDTAGKNGKGKTFLVYAVLGFLYDDEYWLSSLSDEYVEVKMDSTASHKVTSYTMKNGASTGLSSDYIVDYLKVSTEPVRNFGCYKVVVDDEFLDRVALDRTGITYSIIAKNTSTNEEIESKNFTFYLPSPGKYEIFLKAENSSRQYVKSNSYRCLLINGTGSNQERYLDFSDDLSAPEFTFYSASSFLTVSPAIWEARIYALSDDGSGLVTDSSGNALLDYYLIPCSSSFLTANTEDYLHDTYTLEDLEGKYSDYKKTIAVDVSGDSTKVQIPFDGADEGLYTISFVAKDNSGNSTVKNLSAFNRRLGNTFNYSLYISGTSKQVRSDKPFVLKTAKGLELGRGNNGQNSSVEYRNDFPSWDDTWLKIEPFFYHDGTYTEYGSSTFYADSTVENSGFYDVIYFCFGYERQFYETNPTPMVVNSKNIIPGWNGLQVLCDAPTFAHTMYCKKNLSTGTAEENIRNWENCAQETGYKESKTNFTYGNENYDNVPSGYYYITIVHFADGTILTSDVNKK